MGLNTALLGRHVRRLLAGRAPDITEMASDMQELWPQQVSPGRPALFPPGALERCLGLSPWRDWQTEQALIRGDPVVHAATQAYLLRNAVFAGTHLYLGPCKHRVGHGEARYLEPDLPPRQHVPEAHLASVWTGADFFGSFLRDNLTLEMIPSAQDRKIGARGKRHRHAAGYRDLLGLPEPPIPGHARIDRLTIYRDYGQNQFKRQRYDSLRSRLRASVPGSPGAPGVFLRRGTDGEARRLLNEEALLERLAAKGFRIVDPAHAESVQIAAQMLDAPIVIAVEGSHLSHAVYTLAAGGAFLVIQPPDRFALPFKEFADCMEMRFAFVVARPADGGFVVDTGEIDMMLDRLA
ncbi:MAG: glycosyltransferase family 61 protein [Burkholderiales bacterium]|nr:MAG: glycosyltransferase family 61 protein [Burkholderiales bacterium]